MSAEQARGEPIDDRSDLFSLGYVLYFLAAGVPPFDAENTLAVLHKIVSTKPAPLSTLRNDLPPAFVNLVDNAIYWLRSVDKRTIRFDVVNDSIVVNDSGELGTTIAVLVYEK